MNHTFARLSSGLLVAGAAVAGVLAGAPSASAAVAAAPVVKVVCNADNVYLRTEPVGPVIDNLPRGSHFAVYETTPGGWAHGTSYYDNVSGYVDAQYLCNG